ncbi:uncharacterized protein LOC127509089 isoform X2 [Ctenopharyngodon idella]|uniref:uncharacterized protein LOC127509089 isoform X2 n=1 Tax=Ctenopharyngodon idella TaxID=7959 RepID=UPI0022319C1E|nr:uncharacterized protein LOC127509089 isoform X2 [Ctenopharyngodon idella]
MNATTRTITEGTAVNTTNNTIPETRTVKNPFSASRPDWLLYTVPASAFVIGIFLFTYICKTQQRRNASTVKRTHTNGNVATYTAFRQTVSGTQRCMESAVNNNKDYLDPDAIGEQEGAGPEEHQNTLQPPSNLTDTDGESYEDMEGCLYAQPRKRTQKLKDVTEDEDYINPDDGKQDLTLDHTDTESYELMAESDCIYNNTDFTASHDTTEDDSYEQMIGIPAPLQKEMYG